MSKTLGKEYPLHCSWRPQSSEKVEKANDISKRQSYRLTQGTQDSWFKILPIPLMRPRTVPQKWDYLSDRLLLCTDIIIDPEPWN